MKLLDYRFVGVALFVFAGFDVKADGLRIDVSGVYSKDPNFGKSFGSSEAELLFSMSLLIDESQGFYLPAGTPLMSGQPVAEDRLLCPASAVHWLQGHSAGGFSPNSFK